MANIANPDPSQKAQTGILVAGIILLVLILFGSGRQLISQGFASTTQGNTVETQLIDLRGKRSPSIEVIAQLQYTQQALFKAELLTESGNLISQASQDFNSNRSEAQKRLDISNWPNPEKVKVRISVANQSISTTPPQGINAADIPVIFEINAYSRWLNSSYLWPGFFACVGLWIIVKMARNKANSWK